MSYAAEYAQRLEDARKDEASRKAAYDEHFPDFDEHVETMFDDRRTRRVWSDGVVRIPAVDQKGDR
jgi:hypothetical protein